MKKLLAQTYSFSGKRDFDFPESNRGSWVSSNLGALRVELAKRDVGHNLGSMYTMAHPFAYGVYKEFAEFNLGYLGSYADDFDETFDVTRLEFALIHQLLDLYGAKPSGTTGYVTTGGTEGNIFMTWVGREYLAAELAKPPKVKLCLLKTSLTHYSIRKAAAVCQVTEFVVPMDAKSWSMSTDELEKVVEDLHKKGYRGFLLPLTIGYSSTGTSDDIAGIVKVTRQLQRKYSGVKFFVWVDAALNGLIEPFVSKENKALSKPFSHKEVQGFIVDFHKFGLVPYQAGVLLYKKALRKYVEKPIEYLRETDTTLLGSRSGLPAIAMWVMSNKLGKAGYKKLVTEQHANKKALIEGLRKIASGIEIVTSSTSLSCGLIFHDRKGGRLTEDIEKKYSLHPGVLELEFEGGVRQKKTVYKCFFLPHLKHPIIKEFLDDVSQLYLKQKKSR